MQFDVRGQVAGMREVGGGYVEAYEFYIVVGGEILSDFEQPGCVACSDVCDSKRIGACCVDLGVQSIAELKVELACISTAKVSRSLA